jgi:hypothetical protein
MGLVVAPDGITLRGFARTRHIAWERVDRFSMRRYLLDMVVDVHTRDGCTFQVPGTAFSPDGEEGILQTGRLVWPGGVTTDVLAQLSSEIDRHVSATTDIESNTLPTRG